MIQMPMTVDEREMPDADLREIVSHPLRFLRGWKGVVDKRLVAPADHIRGHTDIQRTVVRPIVGLRRARRLRGPAVIKADEIVVNLKHTHIDLTGAGVAYHQGEGSDS